MFLNSRENVFLKQNLVTHEKCDHDSRAYRYRSDIVSANKFNPSIIFVSFVINS